MGIKNIGTYKIDHCFLLDRNLKNGHRGFRGTCGEFSLHGDVHPNLLMDERSDKSNFVIYLTICAIFFDATVMFVHIFRPS